MVLSVSDYSVLCSWVFYDAQCFSTVFFVWMVLCVSDYSFLCSWVFKVDGALCFRLQFSV